VRYDDKQHDQERKRDRQREKQKQKETERTKREQNRQLTMKKFLPNGRKKEKYHFIEHGKMNENRLSTTKEKKRKKSTIRPTKK
jgi:hypothetical protein